MAYTEVKENGDKKYYYRARSVRDGNRVNKERVYLGANLTKRELAEAVKEADRELGLLSALLRDEELSFLDGVKKEFSELPEATRENRYEAFVSRFTHDSTAIEGNTLTLQETAALLFDELAPTKGLREINEILNHKAAFDYLLEYDGDITRDFILELHRLAVRSTLDDGLDDQVGRYRTLQVHIRGVEWSPAPPERVPEDMKELLSWYTRNKGSLHPLVTALYFHVGFEVVHPFVGGNGRVGRLLMNFILRKSGYPMVNIPNSRRGEYYSGLEAAQVKGDLRPLAEFLIDLMKDDKNIF